MKIKTVKKSYAEVMSMEREHHPHPMRSTGFFRWLMKTVAAKDLRSASFSYEEIGMDKLAKDEPAFILMNHSSFIDIEMIPRIFSKRRFNIVTSIDAFAGMSLLMRLLGCIPTKKFVTDAGLLRDMLYVIKNHRSSVIMFPEAGYTFDGTATAMPNTLGACVKFLGVPLVIVKTDGAFLRDPLYNNLQKRRVKVSATVEYMLSAEEVKTLPCEEIEEIIRKKFNFDAFREQQERKIKVSEPYRADYLNRILYKCPRCHEEGKMLGRGTTITCLACENTHTLTEYGALESTDGTKSFTHVPDWYRWEREEVKREIEEGKYGISTPVRILMMRGIKKLYDIGCGTLTHTEEGFTLRSEDGELEYTQSPLCSYSVNSDFNWYEIGDAVSIGDNNALFYCIPTEKGDIVAKIRLAAEELYKMAREKLDTHKCTPDDCSSCEKTKPSST